MKTNDTALSAQDSTHLPVQNGAFQFHQAERRFLPGSGSMPRTQELASKKDLGGSMPQIRTFSCHCSSTALLLSEGLSKPLQMYFISRSTPFLSSDCTAFSISLALKEMRTFRTILSARSCQQVGKAEIYLFAHKVHPSTSHLLNKWNQNSSLQQF